MITNLKSRTGFNKNAKLLLRSSAKAVINAPIDKIDIPEWLFALTDEEYQRCSGAHIAAGATRTPDGSKRIEINVEKVGRPRIDGTALDRGHRGKAALPASFAVRHVRSARTYQNAAHLGHEC